MRRASVDQSTRNASTEEQGSGFNSKIQYVPPVAPKPQSEFMLFRSEALVESRKKFPELPWPSRIEMVSRQWAAMSKADKAVSSALRVALL